MCLSIVRKSFTVIMKAVYQFIINIKRIITDSLEKYINPDGSLSEKDIEK